jgi:uncharacterized membrane protein
MKLKAKWSDDRTEIIMGNLLRIGVFLAAITVFIGGVLYLFRSGLQEPHYTIFKSEPAAYRALSGIFQQAFSLNDLGIIQFGLLLLIATPIARVFFSIIAFILERDYIYILITLIVFCLLMSSLVFGRF